MFVMVSEKSSVKETHIGHLHCLLFREAEEKQLYYWRQLDKFGDYLEGNTSFICLCVFQFRTLSMLIQFLLHLYTEKCIILKQHIFRVCRTVLYVPTVTTNFLYTPVWIVHNVSLDNKALLDYFKNNNTLLSLIRNIVFFEFNQLIIDSKHYNKDHFLYYLFYPVFTNTSQG